MSEAAEATTTTPVVGAVARGRAFPTVDQRDLVLFAVASLAAWAHTVDEVRIGEYIAVPFGAANIAVLGAWPRMRSGWRALTSIAFGLFWGLAVIPYHVAPLLAGTVTGQNISGLSRLAGGAVMVALGVSIVRRRERDRGGSADH
jgi:hypothetical protein